MKKKTTEQFKKDALNKYGDKYDYSKVIYNGCKKKIIITCKKHGDFSQTPDVFLDRKGCGKCCNDEKIRENGINFVSKSILKHENLYDYSLVNYINNTTKVIILCKKHGEFLQTPASHLQGSGCPKCNKGVSITQEEFLIRSEDVHGKKYEYSNVIYKNIDTKVGIICKEHGEFFQTPYWHMRGSGCRKCGINIFKNKMTMKFDIFLEKAKNIYGDKYNYFNKIGNNSTLIPIECKEHGLFYQTPAGHLVGKEGCKKCSNNGISIKETELYNFIKEYIPNTIQSYKIGNKEIDIFIPELNLGIEFNGLYWHSDNFKDNNSHLNKLNLSNENNINLIQIFEDELDFKEEIVKSRILNILGKTPNKIYARKTLIKEVPTSEAMKFLEENHIQGKVGGKLKIGLYFENELVSIMTFGNLRKNLGQTSKEGSYELLRFCNKLNTTVIGGASKLFKYFIKTYSPEKVISYADRRWSQGNLYFNLGFDFIHNSQPNYFYVKNGLRESRFKYRKDILVSQGYDKNKTEREIMKELGYNRIYDCGAMKFEWKNN